MNYGLPRRRYGWPWARWQEPRDTASQIGALALDGITQGEGEN
jgi:hypothetical protein